MSCCDALQAVLAENDLQFLEELKSWGHPGGDQGSITLKSDGEPAIVAVRESLAKLHGGMVTPEQPPRGEHQSNGAIEEAGRTTRDMLRVLKLQLEARIKQPLDVDSPIIQWMCLTVTVDTRT